MGCRRQALAGQTDIPRSKVVGCRSEWSVKEPRQRSLRRAVAAGPPLGPAEPAPESRRESATRTAGPLDRGARFGGCWGRGKTAGCGFACRSPSSEAGPRLEYGLSQRGDGVGRLEQDKIHTFAACCVARNERHPAAAPAVDITAGGLGSAKPDGGDTGGRICISYMLMLVRRRRRRNETKKSARVEKRGPERARSVAGASGR